MLRWKSCGIPFYVCFFWFLIVVCMISLLVLPYFMHRLSYLLSNQAFTSASQGLLNCLVYGWTQQHFRTMVASTRRDANTQTPLLRSQKSRDYSSLSSSVERFQDVWGHTPPPYLWDWMERDSQPASVLLVWHSSISNPIPQCIDSNAAWRKNMNVEGYMWSRAAAEEDCGPCMCLAGHSKLGPGWLELLLWWS